MQALPNDIMLRMGAFLNPTDAVTLFDTSKVMRDQSDQLLKNQYKKTFGEVDATHQADKKIIARLLCCADKQPKADVNHNIHQAPSDRLERWRWMLGFEHSLDREVQKNYNENIQLLEHTQTTSIIQLKNQMKGFWHTDRQIKDYIKLKADTKARATSNILSKIFFKCVELLFKCYYTPSAVLQVGKDLEARSRKTFAKIGEFNLNSKEYNVVAFHLLADEKDVDPYGRYCDETHRQFSSISYGKTYIGIYERQQPHTVRALGHYGSNHNFCVHIERGLVDRKNVWEFSSEESIGHGKDAVSNKRRRLSVDNGLTYRDSTHEPQGSDRLLDQKLTQIMIELTMQNKDICSLQVSSNGDEFPLLAAGGFDSRLTEDFVQFLYKFRSQEENKLFPPKEDYSTISTQFKTQNFNTQNVFYSKGDPKSWSAIIQRKPILKPEAAILPEYWAVKPNIVEE